MAFAPLDRTASWEPPADWLRIRTVDAHTEGEPFRVILSGFPELPGATILERRREASRRFDHLRRALMWEPRGHADMYGCIVTPPVTPGAHAGVLFIHNEGFSTMCGHGIIGFTTVAFETGMFPAEESQATLRIDSPAGLITSVAHLVAGRVRRVSFRNVPSFVVALDESVEVPGIGKVRYDLAFGGAFYAFVEAPALGLATTPGDFRALIDSGMRIKRAVMAARPIPHPFEPDLSFLYGTIFTGPPGEPGHHSRHVCVFADGEVDRSPTGTGVSARLALLHARGELAAGAGIVIESILGTTFAGRVAETAAFGPHPAVIPEISGTAHITGRHEFLLDPADNLPGGFLLR